MRIRTFGALISREWRTSWADRGAYILRAVYATVLLLGVIAAWVTVPLVYSGNPEWIPELMRSMFDTFCRVQFGLASVLAAMTFSRAVCREQEQGTLDLLILSPLSRTEILVGKLAGEFLGVTALVASGIPVLFLLMPFGGVSPQQILIVQGVVLAQVLVVGGLCVAMAAALGRSIPVMICALAAVGLLVFGPDLGREWISQKARIWGVWESVSTYGILVQQTTKVQPEPGPALTAFGVAAALGVLCCGLGSLVLEWRYLGGAGSGWFASFSAALRRFFDAVTGKHFFGRLSRLDAHPLMRREVSFARDQIFRVVCIAGVVTYIVLFQDVARRTFWKMRPEPHLELSFVGMAVAVLIAVILGAFQIGWDRRRGILQTLLAAGVSPEELVRSRLAGLVMRALYLVALPVAHFLSIVPWMDEIPGGLFWRIPAALAGFVLGLVLTMQATVQLSFSLRRPEIAVALAILGVPTALFCGGVAALTLSTFAVGVPLAFGGALAAYAFLVRHTRKWILR